MTRYRRPNSRNSARSRALLVAQLLAGAGLVFLLVWLVLSVVLLARAVRSLQAQQQRIEILLEAGILNANPDELEQITVSIRDDVVDIRRVAGPFAPFGPYVGWLPAVGPLLADAQPLLDMADAASEMAIYGVPVVKPLLANNQENVAVLTDSLPQLISVVDQAEANIVRADLAAGRLFEARAALEHVSDYPDRVSGLLARFDENAALLHDGLKLARVAPELLGRDRPKTYLILAQNEDELRPTGGFISGAGLVTVDKGQIVSVSFINANAVDDWRNKPYELPPEPFTKFMGMDILLFRDINFWPDFPQSAAQAMALYTYGQGVLLDGVVAFDQYFLQQLLAQTGPLPVPELDRVVNANNVISQLREEWGPGGESEDWIAERKAFMGPLAGAFLLQLSSGALSIDGIDLVQMLQEMALQRHLQLYSADPATALRLNETVWSGRMGSMQPGDFLHVSDTNMGFNKVNDVLERSLSYQVNLAQAGRPTARLEVHYNNPPAAGMVECQHGTRYSADTQYESLTSDCYWNYLRAYVPQGSQLIGSSEHPVPAANLMSGAAWPGNSRTLTSDDAAFTTFDNFLLLGTGQEATVSFQYTLPETVRMSEGRHTYYRLQIQKQAGTISEFASVQVTLPEDAELVTVRPQPSATAGNMLVFGIDLVRDIMIDIHYKQ